MSSSFVSRWVVARTYRLDADAVVTDDVIEEWITEIRDMYVEQCTVLREATERAGLQLRFRMSDRPSGAFFGRPETVLAVTPEGGRHLWAEEGASFDPLGRPAPAPAATADDGRQ